MTETLDFLTQHGTLVLFLAVFVEQIGIPPPAAPWLLAAGTLAGTGKMSIPSSLAAPLERPKSCWPF
jgi:membrane protein DedA with SNARE-associated domain